MEALTVDNIMQLSGLLLYVPVIFCLVEVVKKMLPENGYDAWLPAISIGLGMVVVILPEYIGPTIDLYYKGILIGGCATGAVSAWKGRKSG